MRAAWQTGGKNIWEGGVTCSHKIKILVGTVPRIATVLVEIRPLVEDQ